jgi:predicted site-specific integrase-resolvase
MEEKKVLLTTEEASKIIGITRQGFAYLVKQGRIKPVDNIKSKYKFFDEAEIYRYLKDR